MIQDEAVSPVSVRQLLAAGLCIPAYQRPYSWTVDTALRLYDDLRRAFDDSADGGPPYVLGAVILHRREGSLDLVDGQQRLLTLRLLTALLGAGPELRLEPSPESPVGRVWRALRGKVDHLVPGVARELCDFILDRCEVVRVVTDDVDEAFRVFDSQNYRGKPLAPHDLLKAYHLREMGDETDAMKKAVVDTWEAASGDDLDRLFSLYLYRIVRWSQGERAGVFTAQDIDVFKGLDPRTPSGRYHLAAQATIPMMMQGRCVPPGPEARHLQRARFQLDSPVTAGRAFFEMTTFMLGELVELRKEAYPAAWEDFSSTKLVTHSSRTTSTSETLKEVPAKSRYRKVGELYLAALLYFTNRFGNAAPEERAALFGWAYALRVELQRVQHASIDKRASGEGEQGLFSRIRRAQTPAEVVRACHVQPTRRAEHEERLVALLDEMGMG